MKRYRKVFIAVLLLGLFSCKTDRYFFYFNIGEPISNSIYYISMEIIKGGHIEMYNTIEEVEKCYCYPDSSFFYISNYYYNENTNNIESLGDSIFEYRFQNRELCKSINDALGMEYYHILPDTFELSGMNADSLCWRDVLIDNISIGYVNVRPELKAKYDQCLNTYSVKKEKKKNKKIIE
jgi:hypothetical protein